MDAILRNLLHKFVLVCHFSDYLKSTQAIHIFASSSMTHVMSHVMSDVTCQVTCHVRCHRRCHALQVYKVLQVN